MSRHGFPPKQGLYDPWFEHDACGVNFLADLKNRKSHALVEQALQAHLHLTHRGACGCETNTGDGAGILIQTPHKFLAAAADRAGFRLPAAGAYAAGLVFLPKEPGPRRACEEAVAGAVAGEGQTLLGWRDVPVDNSMIGPTAKAGEPFIRQVFVGRGAGNADAAAFERKLYVIRRRAENAVRAGGLAGRELFYIPSLSHKTIVYKGMLMSEQLAEYFPDLRDPALESALAMLHTRFSTNTFPNWARAHPYRYVCHNGEINTLRGNINWMHARETMFRSPLFGDDIAKLLPIIDEDGSDSAMFDNCLELLVLAGRPLTEAVMMMIPEPWSGHEAMDDARKAFYEYHAALMEPWDGPASIAFTDGARIGAVLDRNGLRPARFWVTKDDLLVMASETGVLDIPPDRVARKGRLQPGRMLLVDLEQGRIVADEEIKREAAAVRPYRAWLQSNLVRIGDLPAGTPPPAPSRDELLRLQQAAGYTAEDVKLILPPMGTDGVEAVGSMGTDTPLAVLSERPQLLYNYFKQLFAQVTNPPVDSIREELIMSAETIIGGERNLLDPTPESARQLRLPSPILTNDDLARLKRLDGSAGFKTAVLSTLFPAREAASPEAPDRGEGGAGGLRRAMDELRAGADRAIEQGCGLLLLSDRGVRDERAAIPALLAVSGVHHHLIRKGTRTHVGIVVESAEPREVHHLALLIGYGAGAVNPWLVYETLADGVREGTLPGVDAAKAVKNYVKAATKGVVKVISKMGISTIQSYHGAQIFEAIGLHDDFVKEFFTGTASRVGGIGLDEVAGEALARHARGFPDRSVNGRTLDAGGQYQYRKDGELHLFDPETIHRLQLACRTGNYKVFQEYTALVDDRSRRICTLRGLLDFKFDAPPVPLAEVEPVEAILARFKSGAMSYGSISKEAHETLAVAMNRIGGKSNTGEGGEDPARYVPEPNGDSKNSAIKQVASARFGVTSWYLVNAQELQIKIAQGAKPGEGGQLPGSKVYPWIARVRYATPGVGLISPPPHHDIYSIEDLAQLIHDLKNGNPRARISVKLVAEAGVGTVAAGVAKARADVVLISGHDGGTGASPLTSIKHAGGPWELGLAETQQVLVLNGLRSRIRVEADGQLKTGRDVVVAALLGAEEFGFATAPLVALGCILMRVCHLNTCPVGVATQNPELRKRFTGDPAHAVNFMRFIAQEVREHMAKLGYRRLADMVGQTRRLEQRPAADHWKRKGIDLSRILHAPEPAPGDTRSCTIAQDHGLDKSLDRTTLLDLCRPALEKGDAVAASLPIRNVHRAVGTILGSEVTRKYGPAGLPDDTITLHFQGSAGQSFGAFVPKGITLALEGDANDYFGKGLSGGKLFVYPPEGTTYPPEENIIIGNVALYGATDGEAYVRGAAGERFCVRNSGVKAVVEGVGDHGCEYMTGGRVVVIGATGRNFAAGMSGGIAYVLDVDGTFPSRCNRSMVGLYPLSDPEEAERVRSMIRRHADLTGSGWGREIEALWETMRPKFVKVLPHDFKRALEAEDQVKGRGLTEEESELVAFEINAKDASRVGGN